MSAQPLWSPSQSFKEESNLHAFATWLKSTRGIEFDGYQSLWQWSVTDIAGFWQNISLYFDLLLDGAPTAILSPDRMPHVRWFEGTRVNYAEHVFRSRNESDVAIIYKSETSATQFMTWKELSDRVSSVQHFLIERGIKKGDCVAAYIPCIPEATVAFLAVNSLGAIWTSCSPDFGTQSVIDRFAQTSPKVLFATTTYSYAGKTFDKTEVMEHVLKAIPSVHTLVTISDKRIPGFAGLHSIWENISSHPRGPIPFTRVPFNHPIWVLYSSGTTGLPKAITHSHGGILLEHLKYLTFHNNFKPGQRCFWYTTTGWMMWNYIQSSLLCGATLVLYDGSPGYPDLNILWKFVSETRIQHFGTSAGFILSCMKSGINPGNEYNFDALKSIGSTGSTLPPEGFEWTYQKIKKDIWLASMSGGTDVCSAFAGGNPLWPVFSGQLQCRALGCSLEAYDEHGNALKDQVGEMVITKPMPSMPIYFWNDPEYKRYTESYFETFPGVWRHGDWVQLTPQYGLIISGRSDATLNRGGVRIGTSEVYRAVDKIQEVKDSLIVCLEKENGDFFMPLFVQMHEGILLTSEIEKRIAATLRDDFSPRHVPDRIFAVPEIPYTISGKKTETPVKKILMGADPKIAVNMGSLRNPGAMEYFFNHRLTLVQKKS
jgi:acetoacetyl-CoA synthetase